MEDNLEDWEWRCPLCQNINDIEEVTCACCGQTKEGKRIPILHDDVPRIITQKQRFDTLKRQGWKCNNCGCSLKYSKVHPYFGEVGHIDHIHPYSKRDTYPNGKTNINEDTNLQALCPKCNISKSKKEIN